MCDRILKKKKKKKKKKNYATRHISGKNITPDTDLEVTLFSSFFPLYLSILVTAE